MKRKLALMLTMTLLAGSLDSGMLVSAADFSAEESVEQAVEEELFPAVHSFLPSTFLDNGVVVEAGAFKQCTSLTRIHIPASMVTHGYVGESSAYPGIFAGDTGLTTVTFVKGITKIAKYRTRLRLRQQALPQ